MNSWRRFVVLCWLAPIGAAPAVGGHADQAPATCELSVAPEAPQLLLGKPLKVTATCTNTAPGPASEVFLLDPQHGQLSVFIAASGEVPREYVGPDWGIIDLDAEPITLGPGERVQSNAVVLWNHIVPADEDRLQRSVAFDKPGQYELTFSLTLRPEGPPMTAVLNLEVVAPAASDLEVATRILTNAEIVKAVHTLSESDARKVKALVEEILVLYPATSYSDTLRAVIAAAGGGHD